MFLNTTPAYCITYQKDQADTGFSEGGGGVVGFRCYGYFILEHFIAGQIMRCMEKTPADKCRWTKQTKSDKTPVTIAGEDKHWPFCGRGRTNCQSYPNTYYIILIVK